MAPVETPGGSSADSSIGSSITETFPEVRPYTRAAIAAAGRERHSQRLHVRLRSLIGLELLAAPVVVPAWWALWKVCDVLWAAK